MLEAAAGEQQRKVFRGVRARGHAAAEEHHRVIEQRAAVDGIRLRLEQVEQAVFRLEFLLVAVEPQAAV